MTSRLRRLRTMNNVALGNGDWIGAPLRCRVEIA